jgi:PAS domain S-box-containing protein
MGHSQAVMDDELTWYRQMLDSITGYEVVRLDAHGRVCSWHAGAQRMTGYTADEMIGRPFTLGAAEAGVEARLHTELRTAAETGRSETEGWQVRKDGSRFWAAVTITPIRDTPTRDTPVRDPDRPPQGYVIVVDDLTRRRERDRVLRSVEQMLDSITDYEVIRLDREGIVRSWNPGAQRLKQYAAAEVVGHHVSMFYPDEDVRAGLAEQEMAVAAREGRFETEGWRTRRDGSRFWANVVLSPIRDVSGELIGYVKVARDLTERREQEQLVQRQRDEILELSTPVIQVWDKVLVLPIIGTLDSVRATRLTEALLHRISEHQAEVVILEVSGVPAIDTDVAQHLLKTVEAARLMGAASIMAGVRPETAQAIVHLGIELGTLRSRSTLKDALQLALRLVDEAVAIGAGADA